MAELTTTKSARPLSIWAALLSVYLIWGSTYLAIRFAVETLPPFLMIGIRYLLAGGILYTIRRLRGDPPPARSQWRSAAVIGTLLLLGGNGGVAWAEQRIPSGVAALMVAVGPLWMVLLDLFVPGIGGKRFRPPAPLTIFAVLVGFGGIFLLIGPSNFPGLGAELDRTGLWAVIVASLLWSIGSLYSRGADLPASPLLGTGMEMLAGSGALLIFGTLAGEWRQVDIAVISATSLVALLYLVVFGSLVAFAAYTWLLRSAPTSLVSTYAYVNPLVAILLGSLLAAEPVTPRVLLAAGVILGAVVLIVFNQRQRKPEPAAAGMLAPEGND